MCGIAGILNLDENNPVNEKQLKDMTRELNHRGPDDEGYFIDKYIGLGHRRLAIIDPENAKQPMKSNDGRIVLSFNGAIYNYIELRRELEKLGHLFKTNSDTEVIINSYLEWGLECQNKFNGMWAFALWDKKEETLILSRDRFGEKPLYFSNWNNSFIFGSEIKSILRYGVPKEINIEFLEIYLVMTNIPEPYTFYKNINKLESGHYIVINNKGIKHKKYWDLGEIDENNMLRNKEDVYENFSYLLNDSIKIRMRSDVEYGAFLSGGLDSTSIVALMSENSRTPINTFTIGFQNKRFDESRIAEKVSNYYNTKHTTNSFPLNNFSDIVNKITSHFDEPFGDSSAIPTGFVSNFASKKVKMVLTGDGGDEALSGYPSYQGIKIASLYKKLPTLIQRSIPNSINILRSIFRGDARYFMNKAFDVSYSSSLSFSDMLIHKRSYTDFKDIKKMCNDIPGKLNIEDYIYDFVDKIPYQNPFYKLMYFNIKYDLPNQYLTKVDRMSMASSLETRIPFLDYRLIEYMIKVDKNIKMTGFERKSVLRETIGHQIPKSVLKASKKGFTIPLRDWFKKDSFNNHLDEIYLLSSILDKKVIEKIMIDNKIGAKDNGNFIWQLLLLKEFLN